MGDFFIYKVIVVPYASGVLDDVNLSDKSSSDSDYADPMELTIDPLSTVRHSDELELRNSSINLAAAVDCKNATPKSKSGMAAFDAFDSNARAGLAVFDTTTAPKAVSSRQGGYALITICCLVPGADPMVSSASNLADIIYLNVSMSFGSCTFSDAVEYDESASTAVESDYSSDATDTRKEDEPTSSAFDVIKETGAELVARNF